LDQLFRQADFISLHCPLTTETRNLIDEQTWVDEIDGVSDQHSPRRVIDGPR